MAIVLASCSTGRHDVHELATPDVLRPILARTSEPVRSVKEIPPYIMAALSEISGEKPFRLADLHEPYNATDSVSTDVDRQLRFATRSKSYFIVCYDIGGGWSRSGNRIVALGIDQRSKSTYPILVAAFRGDEIQTLADLLRLYDAGRLMQYRPTFVDF